MRPGPVTFSHSTTDVPPCPQWLQFTGILQCSVVMMKLLKIVPSSRVRPVCQTVSRPLIHYQGITFTWKHCLPLARVSPIIKKCCWCCPSHSFHWGALLLKLPSMHSSLIRAFSSPDHTANTISRHSIHNLVYFVLSLSLPLSGKWQKHCFCKRKKDCN